MMDMLLCIKVNVPLKKANYHILMNCKLEFYFKSSKDANCFSLKWIEWENQKRDKAVFLSTFIDDIFYFYQKSALNAKSKDKHNLKIINI